ncbi:hypothetical protein ACROYT_G027292 [Oculina patagonica]
MLTQRSPNCITTATCAVYVRKDVDKKLKELQDLNIIEDVEGPTPWVSPLVAVPKSNGDSRNESLPEAAQDNQPFRKRNIAEEYINYVTMNAVPKALTLEKITSATKAILRSTTSAAIIGHLRKIFAVHGLPEKFVIGNGANLVSEEFKNFLMTHGIKHRKVTPYWPRANAAVGRFNRTIEKVIRTAHGEGKDWRTDMYTFLLKSGHQHFSP